eukprot:UN06263
MIVVVGGTLLFVRSGSGGTADPHRSREITKPITFWLWRYLFSLQVYLVYLPLFCGQTLNPIVISSYLLLFWNDYLSVYVGT